MSYQVLARKWRPRNFTEVVGQQHVLKPLINALNSGRLHHAWLLTGTRGVGKTTIARILAKSLNCETGITASPCGECSACTAIDQGRFVDLLEIDAASRTKVEDTRELLDNVQYRPTQGRFKVYLIDEVHMLSRHSFNALLKTLEEPPEHVKFLLATTDPQKLPVTVLSRCLQFNLKALSRAEIAGHLQQVLQSEDIAADEQALQLLARAAQGSLRDALSLTDQAIAQGNQAVTVDGVQQMLGSVPGYELVALLQQILMGQGEALLQTLDKVAGQVPDLASLLSELQNLLHQIALFQAVPAVADALGLSDAEQRLARQLPAELIHVFYDILVQARRDLDFASDTRSGVEIALLRMMTFRPEYLEVIETEATTVTQIRNEQQTSSEISEESQLQRDAEPEQMQEREQEAEPEPEQEAPASVGGHADIEALIATRDALQQKKNPEVAVTAPASEPDPQPEPEPKPATQHEFASGIAEPAAQEAPKAPSRLDPLRKQSIDKSVRTAAEVDSWAAIIDNSELHGLARQLARNSVLHKVDDNKYQLCLRTDWAHLLNDSAVEVITGMLQDSLAMELTDVVVQNIEQPTPTEIQLQIDAQRLQQAHAELTADPLAQALTTTFGAVLIEDSVKPI
ncbi:DNA polymerase III subunit gamma/tau [Pseudidiomarina sp.]|uniref:DNA polymerase III subunit gamma/tau n=1 Tax=Pseudidiomarina sp. TaxID=2081707 RepID=UPI00299D1BAA|nr:DNA polymerase III subunit gamma/tau [Pseudidiomarina sp.]MDX1705139.1 DNA polymerase III subunit gamma/tau [Pseudidiomarina sp.]